MSYIEEPEFVHEISAAPQTVDATVREVSFRFGLIMSSVYGFALKLIREFGLLSADDLRHVLQHGTFEVTSIDGMVWLCVPMCVIPMRSICRSVYSMSVCGRFPDLGCTVIVKIRFVDKDGDPWKPTMPSTWTVLMAVGPEKRYWGESQCQPKR